MHPYGRSTSTQWRQKVDRNVRHRCSAENCNLPRWRISGYCYRHARAKWMFGHPNGRHIPQKEYAVEQHEVADFLKQHRAHRAVVAATDLLSDWLNAAGRGDRVPAAHAMRRLWQES